MLRRILCLGLAAAGGFVAIAAYAGTITYKYDVLGRLIEVTYPNGAVIQYAYDANGNRASYVVTGSPNSPPAN